MRVACGASLRARFLTRANIACALAARRGRGSAAMMRRGERRRRAGGQAVRRAGAHDGDSDDERRLACNPAGRQLHDRPGVLPEMWFVCGGVYVC